MSCSASLVFLPLHPTTTTTNSNAPTTVPLYCTRTFAAHLSKSLMLPSWPSPPHHLWHPLRLYPRSILRPRKSAGLCPRLLLQHITGKDAKGAAKWKRGATAEVRISFSSLDHIYYRVIFTVWCQTQACHRFCQPGPRILQQQGPRSVLDEHIHCQEILLCHPRNFSFPVYVCDCGVCQGTQCG